MFAALLGCLVITRSFSAEVTETPNQWLLMHSEKVDSDPPKIEKQSVYRTRSRSFNLIESFFQEALLLSPTNVLDEDSPRASNLMTAVGFLKALQEAEGRGSWLLRQMENGYHPSDINAVKDARGNTLLMIAIEKNFFEITMKLLDLDADPTITNDDGWNAIHLTAVQADPIFLESVLTCIGKNDKALVARNDDWNTPLILASQEGRTKNAQILLSFSELVAINVDLCGSYGETALLAAMKRGHKSTFEVLLLNKADPSFSDATGSNAISYALNSPSLDFMQLIYNKGYGPNIPSHIINEARIQASVSKAIINDSIPWLFFLFKVLRLNLEKEEAISEKETPMYPLARAAKLGNLIVLYFLLKNNVNPNQRDVNGETPLMDAVRGRKMVMARCMMEFGADPNILNRSGQSALMIAKRAGHFHMMQILLSPEYALIRAVYNDDVETIYELLAEGVNPNREDGFGSSLLAKAVRKGNLDMASYLLSFGADPSQFDTFSGKCPMTIAEEIGDINMMNLIADHAALQRASLGTRYY